VSSAGAQRTVRYSVDLLSPVDLGLLRHAEVMREDTAQPETVIATWECTELPL
jgi:hypothetical protein